MNNINEKIEFFLGIYSIYGLEQRIQDVKDEIEQKEKEFNECELRYNPLCVEGHKKMLARDLDMLKNNLKTYELALEEVKKRENK
jgi:hypothetical protein